MLFAIIASYFCAQRGSGWPLAELPRFSGWLAVRAPPQPCAGIERSSGAARSYCRKRAAGDLFVRCLGNHQSSDRRSPALLIISLGRMALADAVPPANLTIRRQYGQVDRRRVT